MAVEFLRIVRLGPNPTAQTVILEATEGKLSIYNAIVKGSLMNGIEIPPAFQERFDGREWLAYDDSDRAFIGAVFTVYFTVTLEKTGCTIVVVKKEESKE